MEKFFTILAWFIAIPSSFVVIIMILQMVVIFMKKGSTIKIGYGAILPWISSSISWAWIFSR